MNNKTVLIITALICLYIGWRIGHGNGSGVETFSDTVIVRDTVAVEKPVAVDSSVVGSVVAKLPILSNSSKIGKDKRVHGNNDSCMYKTENISLFPTDSAENNSPFPTSDSAEVVIPITQKVYGDSTYKAYVSGYMPSLDSLVFYPQTVTINNRFKPPNKRWGLGIQVGYSVPHGLYAGVGISYNLITW